MGEITFPRVGDFVRSEAFVFGYRSDDGSQICVDGKSTTHVVSRKIVMEDGERTALFQASARTTMHREVDLGAYDQSRGSALFIVEGAEIDSRGCHVVARRVRPNTESDFPEEVISFYMGDHPDAINDVEIVGGRLRQGSQR